MASVADSGIATGNELSRAQMRAELHRIQGGQCAVCGTDGKLVMDHDHKTGFCRGLLCQPCNMREGKSSTHADINAYLANPPAGALDWVWELSDWWRPADTASVRKLGITIAEYIRTYGAERSRETEQATTDLVLALGRSRRWKDDQDMSSDIPEAERGPLWKEAAERADMAQVERMIAHVSAQAAELPQSHRYHLTCDDDGMTVSRAYLRQMKAEKDRQRQRQEIERLNAPGLLRLFEIQEMYADPEDPMALATAQFQEAMRQYAVEAGVCGDCLAKFPDPLADAQIR